MKRLIGLLAMPESSGQQGSYRNLQGPVKQAVACGIQLFTVTATCAVMCEEETEQARGLPAVSPAHGDSLYSGIIIQ